MPIRKCIVHGLAILWVSVNGTAGRTAYRSVSHTATLNKHVYVFYLALMLAFMHRVWFHTGSVSHIEGLRNWNAIVSILSSHLNLWRVQNVLPRPVEKLALRVAGFHGSEYNQCWCDYRCGSQELCCESQRTGKIKKKHACSRRVLVAIHNSI